jgi:16S rRNA (adenine1518-N6/adenine1519-N6)-dimethyltransferase
MAGNQLAHLPNKRLGQHFLRDAAILSHIIEISELSDSDRVLEIGAGDGTLTRALLETGALVTAVEIDRKFLPKLHSLAKIEPCLSLIKGDAMKIDHFDLPTPMKVISNLPYQIASGIIANLCTRPDWFPLMVLMVQREVGMRLSAGPGGKDYGTLSLWAGHRYTIEIKRIVPPGAFSPPPKVESALILMEARPSPRVEVPDEEIYFSLIRAAFAMRRKTILNNLRSWMHPGGGRTDWLQVLETAGIETRRRAETLGAEEFAQIARLIPS